MAKGGGFGEEREDHENPRESGSLNSRFRRKIE
jgi:hypothetical protein